MDNDGKVIKEKKKFPFLLKCLLVIAFIYFLFMLYLLGKQVYTDSLPIESFNDTVIDIKIVDKASGDNVVAILSSMEEASVADGVPLRIGDLVSVEEKVNSKGKVVERKIVDNLDKND